MNVLPADGTLAREFGEADRLGFSRQELDERAIAGRDVERFESFVCSHRQSLEETPGFPDQIFDRLRHTVNIVDIIDVVNSVDGVLTDVDGWTVQAAA